jgi:predicted DNA-binding transcriptional regulator YafY
VKRQTRLFAIAEYLRARRTGVTAEALAERFAVGVRTMYRDLDTLREAALPLQAERGPGGGYALDKSYSLPPVNFTAREAALLATVGRWATEMRLVPFPRTLASALDKVRGALSTPAQRELQAHMAKLQFVGVPAHAVPGPIRVAVEEAWFGQRLLRVGYRRSDGVLTDRVVRIKGALMDRGQTVLETEDIAKGEPRQLRLDRIESARLLDEQS